MSTINNDDRWKDIGSFEDLMALVISIVQDAETSIKINKNASMINLAQAMESIDEKDKAILENAKVLHARFQSMRALVEAVIRRDYE